MKKKIMGVVFFVVFPALVFGASPMIEKHIFLPKKAEKKQDNVSDEKLKKSLVFTGVVISDKGKYALVKTKARKKGVENKKIYQEGDEISGAVVSQIASNYIVLLNDDNEVKIKLFSAGKKRPAAPKVVQQDAIQQAEQAEKAEKTSSGGSAAKPKPVKKQAAPQKTAQADDSKAAAPAQQPSAESADKAGKKASNPFAEALKKATQKAKRSAGQAPAATNPFLEAIKRARQKQ